MRKTTRGGGNEVLEKGTNGQDVVCKGVPYEDSFVVDCIGEGRGGITVAESPSYEGCWVNEGSSPVVYGCIVGVERCADEVDLLLGYEDWVGDVEQSREWGS